MLRHEMSHMAVKIQGQEEQQLPTVEQENDEQQHSSEDEDSPPPQPPPTTKQKKLEKSPRQLSQAARVISPPPGFAGDSSTSSKTFDNHDFPPISNDSKFNSNLSSNVAPTWQVSTAPKFSSQDFPSLSNRNVPVSIPPGFERPTISDDKNFPKLPASKPLTKKEKKKTNLPEHIASYFQETEDEPAAYTEETDMDAAYAAELQALESSENSLSDKRSKKAKKKQVIIKFG